MLFTHRAGVLAWYTTGAHETGTTQLEEGTQSCGAQPVFTEIGVEDRHINLLQNVLEVAWRSESVFAPARHPTPAKFKC